MRKAEIFFDAITYVDEELIEQALDHRFSPRKHQWRRFMATAACLALVAAVGFRAMYLGIFGGVGGSSNSCNSENQSTADSVAPEENIAQNDSPDNSGGSGFDSGPTQSSFTATVLEIHDSCLLVEPLAGQWILASADRIEVPTGDLAALPYLAVGDRVTVFFTGSIQETYPARITGVVDIVAAE